MTKIWARRSSSSAQKVYWTLDELGVPHEQIDAGRSFGIVKDAEYLAKNPNGVVPTLEEPDGFVLWESNAIVRYLGAKHGEGTFWPTDPQRRADADRWMDWATTTAIPAINPLFGKLVMRWSEVKDQAEIDDHIRQSDEVLKRLAITLARQPYVAGEHLTAGDVPLGMIINRWFSLPIERPSLPVIEDYYARLSERPAYRRNVIEAPAVI
jgi:glutathione S-transferase